MASFPIRDAVLSFNPYTPGLSVDEIRKKYGLDNVIKMASNENPLGASPLVVECIKNNAELVFRYAQSGNPELVEALAKHHKVSPNNIVIGNGSDEVIDLLIRSCPTPGVNSIVVCDPCFSLYTLQSAFCGVDVKRVPLLPDFSFDFKGLTNAVDEKTAIVFITTPDNPSGFCPSVDEIKDFIKTLPKTCLLVIDEAYMSFCANLEKYSLIDSVLNYDNLVILRTFSKLYGLAGLRLGYGIMPAGLAKALCSVRPPFSINILAEKAGKVALEDTTFIEKTLSTVIEGRSYLSNKLEELGFYVYPSEANFIMVKLPSSCKYTAKDIFESLLSKGIIIRPLTSYGMNDKLRITIGNMAENKMFIDNLCNILNS